MNNTNEESSIFFSIKKYFFKLPFLFRKVKKYFNSTKYCIDNCIFDNDILTLNGWLFSTKSNIKSLEVLAICKNNKYSISIPHILNRPDVYGVFKTPSSLTSGFNTQIYFEDFSNFDLYLVYSEDTINRKKIKLGSFSPVNQNGENQPKLSIIATDFLNTDIENWIKINTAQELNLDPKIYDYSIDIIIPIYNGFDYLNNLFNSVVKTRMNYRLIIINDRSTDERVLPYIQNRFSNNPNAIIINNNENLGFVSSVNKGLSVAQNHVALVNTDTEMPDLWLERLMAPIILNKNTASTTPYTNSGTICSFPLIAKNNDLFENLSLETIDNVFQKINPSYFSMPTGVGFCMGMNIDVINKIGVLDAETFSKGYGEENDWCQRAIKCGYKNVMVENLFVYHKHGGSFSSAEKQRLIDVNQKLLLKKHPNYLADVAKFFEIDPNKSIRKFVVFQLLFELAKKPILIFDHSIGGGASSYIDKKIDTWLEDSFPVILIRYSIYQGQYRIEFKYKDFKFGFILGNIDFLLELFNSKTLNSIYINELVTYPDLYKTLKLILQLKLSTKAELIFLLHDYFAICPSLNLLNEKSNYCNLQSIEGCDYCLKNNKRLNYSEYISKETWSSNWSAFLQKCDSIIAFSNSSANLLISAYKDLHNITTVPHEVKNFPKIEKQFKTTKTINIGLLGVLTYHKGKTIIKEILSIVRQKKLNVNIILIGETDEKITHPNFVQTGKYHVESVPKYIYEYDIDVFLMPSIWPETFSYTTEEIMKMGMPIFAFNLGAPAERVKNYEKGTILENINAISAISSIINFCIEHNPPISPFLNNRILFITEFISFSSRYRVDHLREQLYFKGIPSDHTSLKDIKNYCINDYDTIIIYRCSYSNIISEFIAKAHNYDIDVIYDIDDYIFEFDQIRNLDFMKHSEYKNYKLYSENIRKCMLLCDRYLTSTKCLCENITEAFKNKEVCINRNVASMEMIHHSRNAELLIKKDPEKVILGYFSGTNTHNMDFDAISSSIISLMGKYNNLYIYLAGTIEIGTQFDKFQDRINRFKFVDWRKLPNLVASIDINIMPLEDTLFHKCKSENKWMEAALLKIPTVASYNDELASVIENGKTGFLCKTPSEWESTIESLIMDKNLRDSIGSAANIKVLSEYTTETIEQKVIDFIFDK